MEAIAPTTRGVRCPRCGGQSRVRHTHSKRNAVWRYRACKSCSKHFTTIEVSPRRVLLETVRGVMVEHEYSTAARTPVNLKLDHELVDRLRHTAHAAGCTMTALLERGAELALRQLTHV